MKSPVSKKTKLNQTKLNQNKPIQVPSKNAFYSLFDSLDTLGITLLVSALLHIIVIVALKFEPPSLKEMKENIMHLDVVLVNSSTKTKPNKADALAQANLDRGGNTDENRRMKSALPTQKNKVAEAKLKPKEQAQAEAALAQKQAEEVREQKRVAALEKQSQALMTQVQALKSVQTQSTKYDKRNSDDKSEQVSSAKSISTNEMVALALEMERLEAQISKEQDEYQKRPKRKFVGARTQEYALAMYIESWRQKVEKVGGINYPEAAKEQKLYGQLRITVSIKADGTLEDIKVDQSSGHRILDNAAKRIVEMGAPYNKFSDEMRKDTDILSITRTMTFTRNDSLSATE